MKLVVDASVVVKLMHEEDGSEDAIRLFVRAMDHDVELISSARMPSEVGNAIIKHLNAEDGEPFIEQVFELDIDMVPIDKHLVSEVMHNAIDLGISFYDSGYMTIAEKEVARFVTEDKELLRKIPSAIDIKKALRTIER